MRIEDSLNSFQYFSIQRAFKAPVLKSRVVPCSIKMHIILTDTFGVNGTQIVIKFPVKTNYT